MLLWSMKSGLETAHLARTSRAVCLVSGLGLDLMMWTNNSGSSSPDSSWTNWLSDMAVNRLNRTVRSRLTLYVPSSNSRSEAFLRRTNRGLISNFKSSDLVSTILSAVSRSQHVSIHLSSSPWPPTPPYNRENLPLPDTLPDPEKDCSPQILPNSDSRVPSPG